MKKLALMTTIFIMLAVLIVPVSPVGASPDQEILHPSDNGTFTDWTAFGATYNWECVDEVPPDYDDETTYVSTTTNNLRDSYNLQDHTTGTGAITNVRVYVRAITDGTAKTIRIAVVIGGAPYDAAAEQTVSKVTYTNYYDDWPQNPATSANWTWTDIDDLEASFSAPTVAPKQTNVTTVWVEVTYTLPPDISNTPSEWNLGTVVADSFYETGTSNFTVTNNSAYPVTITISGDNMTGDGVTWFLSDNGEPGENIYALKAGLADTSYNITVPQSFANILVSPLAGEGGTQQWGLQFLAPTSFDKYGMSLSANITLTAAQS